MCNISFPSVLASIYTAVQQSFRVRILRAARSDFHPGIAAKQPRFKISERWTYPKDVGAPRSAGLTLLLVRRTCSYSRAPC